MLPRRRHGIPPPMRSLARLGIVCRIQIRMTFGLLLRVRMFESHRWSGRPLTIGNLDWITRKIGETLIDYVARGAGAAPVRAFFITNTEECRRSGSHWISIAVGMRWEADRSAPDGTPESVIEHMVDWELNASELEDLGVVDSDMYDTDW